VILTPRVGALGITTEEDGFSAEQILPPDQPDRPDHQVWVLLDQLDFREPQVFRDLRVLQGWTESQDLQELQDQPDFRDLQVLE
jgi:hypothetical protein